MKANVYIQMHGLHNAQSLLMKGKKIKQGCYFFWCDKCGDGGSSEHLHSNPLSDSRICANCGSDLITDDDGAYLELKTMVDACELVQDLGGYGKAHLRLQKALHDNHPETANLIQNSLTNFQNCSQSGMSIGQAT